MLNPKIGVDLGTVNTLVYVPGKGVALEMPTLVALELPKWGTKGQKFLALGEEARSMHGKAPRRVKIAYPLKEGVIADYQAARAVLEYCIRKVLRPWQIFKPDIVVSVSAGANSAERRALIKVIHEAGARQVYLAYAPLLAILGSGAQVNKPVGRLVVDIGGGTTEVAIISMGSLVLAQSLRTGGRAVDLQIQQLLRRKYGLQVSLHTAEQIKMAIGRVSFGEEEILEFRGSDLIEGLPKEVEISSSDIAQILQQASEDIVEAIKKVLSETPPEILADILDQGMVLTGGGALLRGLPELITQKVKVNASLAKEPALCVVKGTGVILQDLKEYRDTLMRLK